MDWHTHLVRGFDNIKKLKFLYAELKLCAIE